MNTLYLLRFSVLRIQQSKNNFLGGERNVNCTVPFHRKCGFAANWSVCSGHSGDNHDSRNCPGRNHYNFRGSRDENL